MIKKVLFIIFILFYTTSFSQISPVEGIRVNNPNVHAFINAKIVIAPGKVIENGVIVIRNSKIESVGEKIIPPADAKVWDLKGMTVYPGFIEPYWVISAPKPVIPGAITPDQLRMERRTIEKTKGPFYWNDKVIARQNAEELFSPDEKIFEKMRSQGFTSAVIVPNKGIFRGSSMLINLTKDVPDVLKREIFQHLSLNTDMFAEQAYPNSLMGVIALIRQVFYDAQWYKKANEAYEKDHSLERPETITDLEVLNKGILNKSKFVFEVSDELNFIRAMKIIQEFSLTGIICGSGYEYRRLEAIKKFNTPVIIPLNFPEAPPVSSPEEALNISYKNLKHWEAAPFNPKVISESGLEFALTSNSLKDQSHFLTQLRKSVQYGLKPENALAALTITPARLTGTEKDLGTIEKGKFANLIISDGDIFNEKTKINEVWVKGERYEVKPKNKIDPRGIYSINLNQNDKFDTGRISFKGEPDKLEGFLSVNKKEIKLNITSVNPFQISFNFSGDSIGMKGIIRMTGNYSANEIKGTGESTDGSRFSWSGKLISPYIAQAQPEKKNPEKYIMPENQYPPTAFGRKSLPEQPENLLIKNATIWTCGSKGIIEKADLLIKKGKITEIGLSITPPKNAIVIDASNKHITPGIIDAHSHTAVEGNVNETGKTLTSETRIIDVIDCDDISIYRQLAGGTTMCQNLHGSANPIGGQTAIIKFRWGMLPDEMIFEDFTPGLKLALGENVKQSNVTERINPRYPQTRMGVEQILADEFQAALDYKKVKEKYEKTGKGIPPRKNLELEPVLELVEGKRQANVHAYRQDEMLMILRLAEKFNFRIASFIHSLEGYKIADIMAKHGVAGSSFSDWWGYKFEVWDAIPFNGAIMDATGVSVSYNSDSDELARRLNLEAAKAIKYGGLTPENALKFVTLNPAIQLKIDKRVGSLEAGKDADFVIWNGDPLSTFTICEQTWVDGRKYFDRMEDLKMREDIKKDRARIIQKILSTKRVEQLIQKTTIPEKRQENLNLNEKVSK